MPVFTCPHCGKIFKYTYENRTYCSVACRKAARVRACIQCGTSFGSYIDTQYCGPACAGIGRRKRIALECQHCGKSFERVVSNVKTTSFCSKECAYASRRNKIERTCDNCDKPYQAFPSQPQSRYCSSACCYAAKTGPTVSKTCKHCGVSFEVSSSLIDQKYCSLQCRGAACTTKTTINCRLCGEAFQAHLSEIKDGRAFCSRHCARRYEGETRGEQRVRESLIHIGITFHQEYTGLGRYALDFYLPDYNIDLEVDGRYWHSTPERQVRDRKRDAYLLTRGITTIRIPERDALTPDIEQIIRSILIECARDSVG